MDIPDIGFIILRHVRDELTNMYWQLSYDSIRNVYPDDNSDKNYLTHKEITNAEIIEGEYPGRGELLTYTTHDISSSRRLSSSMTLFL